MKQKTCACSRDCLELCIQIGKGLYKWFDRRLEQLGLTPVQLQVLAVLPRGKTMSMSELKEQLCCANSNVTAIVKRMADAGWVERKTDSQDRRVNLVRITPQGSKLLAAVTNRSYCCPDAEDWLTVKEWAELMRLLGKLRGVLE